MFFFTNYGCLYDKLVLEHGEEKAFSEYARQKGKYVLVNAEEDDDTRLFIQTLYTFESADRKHGWWNTFTICKTPQKAGQYIAQIDEVRKDKKGYPNFVVSPVMEIDRADILGGVDFLKKGILDDFFLTTHYFTEHCDLDIIMRGYNLKSLSRRLNEAKYFGYPEDKIGICKAAMHAALNGHLTLKEIIQILLSPTDEKIAHEKYVAMLREFVVHREEKVAKYPHLVKKLNRMIELDGEWQIKHNIEHIMFGLVNDKYYHAVEAGHLEAVNGDDFDQTEAYLKFDAERKAKNKAKKHAAEKAKKQDN